VIWRDAQRECHCRIDEPAVDQEAGFDDRDRKVMADVRNHGWHLLMIADDPITRGWVFSVGMWHTLGSPELALFGLDAREAAAVLNAIGDAIRGGRSIGPDVVMDDMLAEDRLVAFRAADESWYGPLFGYATWFGQRPPLPIAQVVWADAKGKFPWDVDVDDDCRANQPSLWVPTDEHPISPWTGAVRAPEWPFSEWPSSTAWTTKRVAAGDAPILFVAHDRDGSWQFIDADQWVQADIVVSHLAHIVDQDATLGDIADLPVGWQAERAQVGGPWSRAPLATEADAPAQGSRRSQKN